MKKLSLIFILLIVVSSLAGCLQDVTNKVDEGKTKVEYYTKMGTILLSTTNATLNLNSLYRDPLRYGTEQWKEDFYKNKTIIEANHRNASHLMPPSEVQEAHDGFISALELTMEVNNGVDKAIQSGEKLSNGLTNKMDETLKVYQSFSELIKQSSN